MNSLRCLLPIVLITPMLIGCGGTPIPPSLRPNPTEVAAIQAKLQVAGGAKKEEKQVEFSNEFATLKGTITLNGAAPTNPTLNINKDVGVCKPGGAAVTNDIVIVGPSNGLANVLVYATVPPEWCHPEMVGKTDMVEFDQKQCLFLDRIFPMQTTQTLKVLNSDRVGHNADMKPAKNPTANVQLAVGGSFTYPPEGKSLRQEKAPFTVNCAAHPWMQSYMIFRENGYFSVTGEDGSFELPNLPAGVPVTISVWHEASKGVPGKEVSVQPEGIAEDWGKRGSFTVNLEPNSQSELQIAVNSSALTK